MRARDAASKVRDLRLDRRPATPRPGLVAGLQLRQAAQGTPLQNPLEAIKQISAEKPQLFTRQPSHDMLGLNTYRDGFGGCSSLLTHARLFSSRKGSHSKHRRALGPTPPGGSAMVIGFLQIGQFLFWKSSPMGALLSVRGRRERNRAFSSPMVTKSLAVIDH
jgi:hypothetical protein